MNVFKYIFLCIILILVQVLLLNHLNLWGATPIIYIWLVMKLPNDMPRGLVITIGFFIGLVVDLFCNTPGLHAFSTATIAFLRWPLLLMFIPRDDLKTVSTGISSLGVASYFKYLTLLTFLFCIVLYLVESLSFFNPIYMIIKMAVSAIMSIVVIFGLENIVSVNVKS